MNTICNFPDIDIYLLYYLDIKSMMRLMSTSQNQYNLLSGLEFIKELKSLKDFEKIHIINYAAKYNYLSLIIWIDKSINNFDYNAHAITMASEYANIRILDWFDKSDHEFKYNESAINYASLNGYVDVLEWFDKSDYEFKYNDLAISFASLNGHINILD